MGSDLPVMPGPEKPLNLAQPLDDEDAARHIIKKMPDNLAPDKRRMIEWLQDTGRWSERKLIL